MRIILQCKNWPGEAPKAMETSKRGRAVRRSATAPSNKNKRKLVMQCNEAVHVSWCIL